MECRECGALNLDGAKRCIECGVALRTAEKSEGMHVGQASSGAVDASSHSTIALVAVVVVAMLLAVGLMFAAGGRPGRSGGGGSVASTGTAPPAGAHTQAAEQAATSLEGDPVSLTFVESSPYVGGQLERYSSSPATGTSGVDYYFDSGVGRIVRRDDFSESPGLPTMTLSKARSVAEAFATKNMPFFGQPGMVLRSSGGAGGTASQPARYVFYWVKQDPASGAILPTFLSAEVDAASGLVRSFSSADASVTISTVPKVSEDDAVASASKGLSGASSKRTPTADLYVGTVPVGDPAGKQTLLWVIGISATDSSGTLQGGRVYIDAMTGEVVTVDQLN